MKYKRVIAEALFSFLLWTTFLTPYMIIVTKTTYDQFISWIGMQAILVPPLSVVVLYLLKKILKRLKLDA